MKKKKTYTAFCLNRYKKQALALPMALIILLIAGALVAVSIYLIENMVTVNRMKNDDELRMNAALSGIEMGKSWVFNAINGDVASRRRPRWGNELVSPDISELVVFRMNDTVEGVSVESVVFDVLFDGIAPNLDFGTESLPLFGKIYMNNYDHSSDNTLPPLEGAYVIRSRAFLNGIEKIFEQGILVRMESE